MKHEHNISRVVAFDAMNWGINLISSLSDGLREWFDPAFEGTPFDDIKVKVYRHKESGHKTGQNFHSRRFALR